MDLRRLSQFLTLVDSENFAQAADKAGISKSTLSHSIAKLEEELGVSLVIRNRGGFRLTSEGRMLVEPARRLMTDAHAVVEGIQGGVGETIVIGVPRMADTRVLLKLIDDFTEQVSEACHFRFVQDTYVRLKDSVRCGRVDFGFCCKRHGAKVSEGLTACVLEDVDIYCIASEKTPLANAESLLFEDLKTYAVLPLSGTQLQRLQRYNSMADFDLRIGEPIVYMLGASLKVAMGESVILDYMPWGDKYPGLASVPMKLTDSPADRYVRPQAILYCCGQQLHPLESGSLAQAFWDFACERGQIA